MYVYLYKHMYYERSRYPLEKDLNSLGNSKKTGSKVTRYQLLLYNFIVMSIITLYYTYYVGNFLKACHMSGT